MAYSKIPGVLKTRCNRSYSIVVRIIISVVACFVIVLSLLWPAVLNSQYIFFYDTAGYLRGSVQAFRILFGIESEWSAIFSKPIILADLPVTSPFTQSNVFDEVMAGRSIYYGTMLYLSELLSSLWIAIYFQLLCVVLGIHLTLSMLLGGSRRELPVVLCILGLTTPLSFFVSYLMPDVFAGIAILAIANLISFDDRLRQWMRWAWLALLTTSLSIHLSHLAVAFIFAPVSMITFFVVNKRFPKKAAIVTGIAILIAVLSEALFYGMVEYFYGIYPARPPFLLARIIADGTGYDYLRATCPENGFRVCGFLPVLPLSTDEFLWSRVPGRGVYYFADAETKRLLNNQQMAFVIEVIRNYPVDQLFASLRGFFEQLVRFGINEFEYTESLRLMILKHIPADLHTAFKSSLFYQNKFPITAINIFFNFVLSVCLIYLAWSTKRIINFRRIYLPTNINSATTLPQSDLVIIFISLILLGLILNAAVTGILSTPHDRYQARVIWLIPMLAILTTIWVGKAKTAVCVSKTKNTQNGDKVAPHP